MHWAEPDVPWLTCPFIAGDGIAMSADTRLVPVLAAESGVFDPREAEGGALTEFYRRYGFAVLRGLCYNHYFPQ